MNPTTLAQFRRRLWANPRAEIDAVTLAAVKVYLERCWRAVLPVGDEL